MELAFFVCGHPPTHPSFRARAMAFCVLARKVCPRHGIQIWFSMFGGQSGIPDKGLTFCFAKYALFWNDGFLMVGAIPLPSFGGGLGWGSFRICIMVMNFFLKTNVGAPPTRHSPQGGGITPKAASVSGLCPYRRNDVSVRPTHAPRSKQSPPFLPSCG